MAAHCICSQSRPAQFLRGSLLAAVCLVAACTNEKPPLATENKPAMAAFCAVVETHRQTFEAIQAKPNYLDKRRDLDVAFDQRSAALLDLLKDGAFTGWTAKVDSVSLGLTGDADFAVRLPCDATLEVAESVQPDSLLFGELRKVHEGGTVKVSGNFIARPPGETDNLYKTGYSERSLTRWGSIWKPTFLVRLTKIEPSN